MGGTADGPKESPAMRQGFLLWERNSKLLGPNTSPCFGLSRDCQPLASPCKRKRWPMRKLLLAAVTTIGLVGTAQAEELCRIRSEGTAVYCFDRGCETKKECRAWRAAIIAAWRKDKSLYLSRQERFRFTRQGIGLGGLGPGDIFRRRPLRPKS